MHIIGFRGWQVMWNWRGWWDSRGSTPWRGYMSGQFTDLHWYGPVEIWRQK